MSIDAGKKFVAKCKETIKDYDDATNAFYMKFIRGADTPTADDVKELAKIIAEMDKVSEYYHTDVKGAFQTFGGPSDTKIGTAKTLLKTIKSKVK